MSPPADLAWNQLLHQAVHSLHRAVRTLRQHAAEPRLVQAAVARCQHDLLAATAQRDVHLQLDRGVVRAGGAALMPYAADDASFGRLAAAGIGEVVLQQGLTAATVGRCVELLATPTPDADPTHDIADALRTAELPGVLLRAARTADPGQNAPPAPDWWLLPAPRQTAVGLRALAARDREANLPLQAARLLLADLDGGNQVQAPTPDLLDGLLQTMLQRGDANAAGWLIEAAQHHAKIPVATVVQLRRRASEACSGDWLTAQVAGADQLQGLLSLAMQLGQDSVQRLAAAAASAGRPLPAWLLELVPRR